MILLTLLRSVLAIGSLRVSTLSPALIELGRKKFSLSKPLIFLALKEFAAAGELLLAPMLRVLLLPLALITPTL